MDVGTFCAQSHVLVVAGKGGVGKTTMTAALAKMAAGAGRSVLIVELEGKSGITGRLRHATGTSATKKSCSHRLRPAEGRVGRAAGSGGATGPVRARRLTPDDALDGVSRGPRPAARVQAAGALGDPRRGVDRHPGHPGRPGPGQGQAAGAGRRRRPDPGGRPGHGARHHLLDLGERHGQRGPGRPPARPGPGRGRAPERPGPLPGDPGHAARGAAGLRDDRVRLHPRGQGGRPARAGDRERLRPRAGGAGATRGRGRPRRRA